MKIDIYPEINFSTARSGGSGGQHVNKVETMVEGRWKVKNSRLVNEEAKQQIFQRLANKITGAGVLLVKSQTERTQLANKEQVVIKMNSLVNEALVKKKSRIALKIPKVVKEKRMEGKRVRSQVKANRKKLQPANLN